LPELVQVSEVTHKICDVASLTLIYVVIMCDSNLIVIATTMFVVLSSYQCTASSSDECSTQRQVAADLWTKPISLSRWIIL